jgi:hypothetical protein
MVLDLDALSRTEARRPTSAEPPTGPPGPRSPLAVGNGGAPEAGHGADATSGSAGAPAPDGPASDEPPPVVDATQVAAARATQEQALADLEAQFADLFERVDRLGGDDQPR